MDLARKKALSYACTIKKMDDVTELMQEYPIIISPARLTLVISKNESE